MHVKPDTDKTDGSSQRGGISGTHPSQLRSTLVSESLYVFALDAHVTTCVKKTSTAWATGVNACLMR